MEIPDGGRLDLTSLHTYRILRVTPGEPEKGSGKERKGEGEEKAYGEGYGGCARLPRPHLESIEISSFFSSIGAPRATEVKSPFLSSFGVVLKRGAVRMRVPCK